MRKSIVIGLLIALSINVIAATPEANRATIFYLYDSWKTDHPDFGKYDLKEGVFGLNAALSPSARLMFELNGTLANAKFDPSTSDLESQKVSSLNDTRLSGTVFSPSGLTSVTAFVNLPTGKTKLDDEEFMVVSAISDNSRRFLVRRFGQGLDIGANGMIYPEAGNLKLHFGAGYLLRGKFQARESDTEKFKYGDEISAHAGFNLQQDKVAFGASGSVMYYMKDKIGDAEVLQAGIATLIRTSVSYTDIINVHTGFAILMRGKGKVQDADAGGDLVDEPSRSGRNEFLWYAGGSYPLGDKARLNGRLEYQNFSENDYDVDNPLHRPKSNYFGIGGGGSYAISPSLYASTMITLYTGKISDATDGGSDSDLSGLSLLFALTYRGM